MEIPQRPARQFLGETLAINSWADLKPSFEELANREIQSPDALGKWLQDLSEVEAVIEEDLAWRYIKMTVDTKDEKLTESYQDFVANIQPEIAPYSDQFNKKLVSSEFVNELTGRAYEIYLRKIRTEIEIYREENVAITAEIQKQSQEYGAMSAAMSIDVDGEKMTMQAAAAELRKPDRAHREKIWKLSNEVRNENRGKLDELFSSLVEKRHQIAVNAGFDNYRDYKFQSLGRFDYTKEDCFDFHASISSEVSPLMGEFQSKRKKRLGVDALRPWDLSVDPEGNAPLSPFTDTEDLTSGSIEAFKRVDGFCGDCLSTMNTMGHLDLASKDGKAPGGYNYPLYEIGVPFIFMNAVGTQRDLVTMMHEGGHAVHSFLTRELELTAFQSCPSEVAELASMSMELISMDHWDVFYKDPETLLRAKKEHLEDLLAVLPWIAIIDKFQHWIYENHNHSTEDRTIAWLDIYQEFTPDIVDYQGIEDAKASLWQKQLHLFEVPFYYIEYGMAQLGAIAVWRNYKQEPKKAIEQYKDALALGYTKSIGEIYETAGIKFDFSREYVKELVQFVRAELSALEA